MRLQRLPPLLLLLLLAAAVSVDALTFKLPATCTSATLRFSDVGNATAVRCNDDAVLAPEDKNLSTQVLVLLAAKTNRLEIADAPQPTEWMRELSIQFPTNDSAAPRTVVALRPTALASHKNLSTLKMENVHIDPPNVVLRDVASLFYLKLVNTDAKDVSLELSNNATNKLAIVRLDGTKFPTLPRFLYERKYSQLALQGFQLALSPESPNPQSLSAPEYENLQTNWNNIRTKASLPNVTFQGVCGPTPPPSPASAAAVCSTEPPKTVVDTSLQLTPSPSPLDVPLGQAPPLQTERETDAPATTAPQDDRKYEPSASSSRSTSSSSSSSSSTTSWVIGVVASCAVAGALAFVVARRRMSAASRERSSFRDDAMVDLISKHDALASDPEVAVLMAPAATTTASTTDLALAPFLLDAGAVTLGKALGSGRLSRGSVGQRKVVVQRVRAEASAGYATQALRRQAELLTTVAHANIAAFVGVAWLDGTDFAVLSESVHKGATLEALAVDGDTPLPLAQRLSLCLDAARAVAFLHAHEPALCCKLSLLECVGATATAVDATEMLGAGEIAWLAPELVRRETDDDDGDAVDPRAANVFALGVLLSEVLTRTLPYRQESEQQGLVLADARLLQRLRTATNGTRLEPHEHSDAFRSLPSTLRDVVLACLAVDPRERPTAGQVVAALEQCEVQETAPADTAAA
ncbi:hypothetical protein PINS_up014180 [Pythium insidiosum]|nr:hypothetical protein PINS_up014180 [Pythium insidiosum]